MFFFSSFLHNKDSSLWSLDVHFFDLFFLHYAYAESIEWFTEDQAFLRLYDSAPLPSSSCLSFLIFLCVAGRAYWRKGRGAD